MIGSVRGVAVMGAPTACHEGSSGRTFKTNSYIIGKICFKLHPSLYYTLCTIKFLNIYFSTWIVPQCYLCPS